MYYRKNLMERDCSLVLCNRTLDDILFKEELDDYSKRFDSFNVHYFVEVIFLDIILLISY